MRTRRFVAAIAVAALSGLGVVVSATPSHAVPECGAGIPAVGSTVGVLPGNGAIWYTTPTGGSFTFTLTVPEVAARHTFVILSVHGTDCGPQLCGARVDQGSAPGSCSITSPTPVNVQVYMTEPYDGFLPFEYSLSVDSLPVVGGCQTTSGVTTCASVSGTSTQGTYAVTATPSEVAARVDSYAFTLPGGGVVTLPCVVLVTGPTPVDPCGTAGGTYTGTVASLARTEFVPSVPGAPFVGINVCNADVVLTVNSLGVSSFPALTIC